MAFFCWKKKKSVKFLGNTLYLKKSSSLRLEIGISNVLTVEFALFQCSSQILNQGRKGAWIYFKFGTFVQQQENQRERKKCLLISFQSLSCNLTQTKLS